MLDYIQIHLHTWKQLLIFFINYIILYNILC